MKAINENMLLEDLKKMRQCADAYCPDHDCKHCKLEIEQDEKVAVLDIVMGAMKTIMNHGAICPIMQTPCNSTCAWYDCVIESCTAMRRPK